MSVIVSSDLSSGTSLQVSRKELVPLFADAIYDALNRPLRFEPTYMEKTIPLGEMYWASNDNQNEFFFPIDIHNYFINLGLKYEAEHFIHQKRPDSRQKISEEERRHQARKEKTEDLEIIIDKAFPKKLNSTSNTSQYFINLAQMALADYLKENPHYPFIVETKVEQGATRRMLLLHFKQRSKPKS